MMNMATRILRLIGRLARAVMILVSSALFTTAFFLVLPLLEQVNRGASDDLEIREATTADLPPPPPPPPPRGAAQAGIRGAAPPGDVERGTSA